MILDDVAIVGTMGWYDYSSRNRIWDNHISISDYGQKELPSSNLELMDRYYANFGLSDLEMAAKFTKDLRTDLQYVTNRVDLEELDSVIAMTHMVPFSEFIEYRGLLKYDYFTAFFGNFGLGELMRELSERIKVHSFFGQTHIPRIKRLSPNLTGYCVPIGYPREYGRNADLNDVFSVRIKEITI